MKEREREGGRVRETDTQTDRHTDTHTDRQRERERERERERRKEENCKGQNTLIVNIMVTNSTLLILYIHRSYVTTPFIF